jgi:N-acetylmuramoyl-L-alanine amidase
MQINNYFCVTKYAFKGSKLSKKSRLVITDFSYNTILKTSSNSKQLLMNRIKAVFFSLLMLFMASSFSSKVTLFGVKTIVIDAGHGGKDPGCHGKIYQEKDVALAVALKLGHFIETNFKDVKVVYTRSTDVFVELQERAAIANRAKADLFISIHCNSACVRDKKLKRDVCRENVNGAETFVMDVKNEQGSLNLAKRENSAMLLEDNYVEKYEGFDPNSDESYIIMSMFKDTYLDRSLGFATSIQKQYCQKVGRCDRGVKRASLWVLWRTLMPSVLTEIGYLTNPEEERFLGSDKGQDYVASGLFRAFREYKDNLEGVTKKYDDIFEKQEPYKVMKEDSSQTDQPRYIPTEPEKVEEIKNEKTPDSATASNKNQKTQIKQLPKSYKKGTKNDTSKTIKVPLQKDSIKAAESKMSASSEIIYKVQITSSDKAIPLDAPLFDGVEKTGSYNDGKLYKYTAGEFTDIKTAAIYQNEMRKKGFKDAFVIATRNGKRIPLK